VSALNFTSGTVAGGKLEPKEFEPLEVELALDPQPTVPKRNTKIVAEMIPDAGLNKTPFRYKQSLNKLAGTGTQVNAVLHFVPLLGLLT